MINDRVTKLSHNQESFNQASPSYTKALKNSGYTVNRKYNKPASVESKNNKQRNKRKTKSKEKVTLSGSTLSTMKKYKPT